MSESKSSEPLPLSRTPDEACHYTQERIERDYPALKGTDDCPACAAYGTRCLVAAHPPTAASLATARAEPAPADPDWGGIALSIVTFANDLCSGQGAIVSPHFILTAVHGKYEIGTQFNVSLKNESATKTVLLAYEWFEENKVDIALLRLQDNETPFSNSLDVLSREVRCQEEISVLSLQHGMGGVLDFSSEPSSIYMIDSKTALCRARYYAEDGLSWSAVVTEVEKDGNVKVIGVHVIAHDATEEAKPIERVSKKSKSADFESVSSHSETMAKNIHGHIAFCMICVAAKVPGVLKIIQNDKHIISV